MEDIRSRLQKCDGYNAYKNYILKFIKCSSNYVFNCHNSVEIVEYNLYIYIFKYTFINNI